jgi:16S rRNA (adenine1518-N6/adenine1519-N6)-dimethyltransferase
MTLSTIYDLEGWESPKSIIKDTGLSPLKSLGQNFLIEKNTLKFICTEADLNQNDAILEIGPGTGALTQLLEQNNTSMMCVEYDKGLANFIKTKHESENLKVIHGDILHSKKAINEHAMEFINQNISLGKKIKIISNLPYKILSPLLWVLFDIKKCWHECIFLVQKEFAQKLIAPIATKDYTPLTIVANLYFNVESLKTVGPKQFWPEPKVTSAIIRLCSKNNLDIEEPFTLFLKHCFSQRRKSLAKLLKSYFKPAIDINQLFENLKIDTKTRAEELSPEQFHQLYSLSHA